MDTCSTNNMRNALTASRKEKNNGRDGTTKRKLTLQLKLLTRKGHWLTMEILLSLLFFENATK